MPSPASDGPLRLSTKSFSERERLNALRELLGCKIGRADFEPMTEQFHADITAQCIGNIHRVTINHSPLKINCTRELVAGGDDDLVLQTVSAESRGSQLGRDYMLKPGDAALVSGGDPATFWCFSKTELLKLSRQKLQPLLVDLDSAIMRRVPAHAPALRFLRGYIALFDQISDPTAELQHCFISHVYDLVAVTLGATRDAAEQARGRGIRAARLQAVKADILAHLTDHTLSIGHVAARHGISTVYVRKLFEEEPLSFSVFVLENRLERARRMLSDGRFRDRAIGNIAFDAGFGDLSYFNRAFRRRFGASPSDIRVEASRLWDAED
jgi:AraC-like DNA-binding protein